MECTGPQQNADDDHCACLVMEFGGGGIHIIGAPKFFVNRGHARSKSSPAVCLSVPLSICPSVKRLDCDVTR